MPSNVALRGSLHGKSAIKAVSGSTRKGVVTCNQAGGPIKRLSIDNLAIVGNSANTSQWGIYAYTPANTVSPYDSGIWYAALKIVRITNTLAGGIWLSGGGTDSLGPMQFLNFDNVSVQLTSGTSASWVGLLLSGQVGQVVFNQVESSYRGTGYGAKALWIARQMDASQANLSDRWGYAMTFNGSTFQGCALAIQIDRAQGIQFNSCWIEDNQSGFLVNLAASGVTFISCVFADTGSNGSGGGYVGQVADTSRVVLISPMIIGTVDTLCKQNASTLCSIEVIGSADAPSLTLSGYPKNFAATGNVQTGSNKYIGITGTSQINSLTSTLDHGSVVVVRALSQLNIVGAGGNIRFPPGWPTTVKTFDTGSRLVFVTDKGANHAVLVTHSGSISYSGSSEIVGTGGSDYLGLSVQSVDSAAPTSGARLFSRVNSSTSKTELCVRFPTGAVLVLSTEP